MSIFAQILEICTDFYLFFPHKISCLPPPPPRLIFSDVHQRWRRFHLKCTKPLNLIQFSKYKNKICAYQWLCVCVFERTQEGYFRTTNLPTKIYFFRPHRKKSWITSKYGFIGFTQYSVYTTRLNAYRSHSILFSASYSFHFIYIRKAIITYISDIII